MIRSYEGRYSSFNEAMNALNDNSAAQSLTNSADVGGQVNVEGESLLVKTALAIVIAVLSIIVYFLKYLVSWGGAVLDLALNPNLYNFVGNDMIRQGWIVVRDVCNLFFLLALLFIAICTILKIEKYHAKKTLLMLIIMALLINFSKPIAIFIFDGSQLLMNFFLTQINGNQQSASAMYSAASKIADSVYSNIPKYFGSRLGSPEIALVYLFSTIFLFMLAVAFIVIAIFLIIRIVAVMLLIIVSPLAFFAAAIPDFNKISSGWWDAMFKYCYYGPAAAFFLLLATKLQGSLPNLGNLNMGGDAGLSAIISNMVQYLLVIVFLYASVIMSNKFGIYAAAGIVGNANRFMRWAGGMTKGGGMWGSMGRGAAWGSRTTGITGGVQQKIAASRFGKYLTQKGREEAQKDREAAMAERIGVKGAKEAREKQKVAEQREKWKKEGKTKADFDKSLDSKNSIERKAAAIELYKQSKVDDTNYAKVLDALKGKYTTAGHAIDAKDDEVMEAVKTTKKKRADLIAEYEFSDAVLNKGRTKQGVYDDVLGSIKPGDIGEQKLDNLILKPEFTSFANATYPSLPNAAQLDMAKNLNAKYAAVFKTNGWVP